jgi:hypothetical protein
MALSVQTIITDALLKVGVSTELDVGDPAPQWLTIGLHELQMLIGEWNCNLTIQNYLKTYSFTPQYPDHIVLGNVADPIYSMTQGVSIPTTTPWQVQLPNTNIETITVTYVTTGLGLTNIITGTPVSGQVLVNYSTGLLGFAAADEGLLVTVEYTWGNSETTHPDIYEAPMDILSVSTEIGNQTYPCRKCSYNDYQMMSQKEVVSSIPMWYAWDAQFPISNIYIWPTIPAGYTIRLVMSRGFVDVVPQSNLDTPDFYYKALVYNLATQLYTNYPVGGLDDEIIYHARASLEMIKHRNRKARTGRAQGRYNSRPYSNSMFTSPGSPLGGR